MRLCAQHYIVHDAIVHSIFVHNAIGHSINVHNAIVHSLIKLKNQPVTRN